MTETKTILLIGRSGRGKSTLANVMIGKTENNFKESSGSASETRNIQREEFKDEENNINYLVIDTPGIGDTQLSDNEVLDIIAEAVYLVKDGVSQVFFVIKGRFDQYEMITYNLLRTIIFDEHITNHTTIVRTGFKDFKKEKKCKADVNLMVKEREEKEVGLKKDISTKEKEMTNLTSNSDQYQKLLTEIEQLRGELATTNLAGIIKSCQERFIHVNNPPIDDVDDEEELEDNKDYRVSSRKKLLKHLNESCQKNYKPEKLSNLSTEISVYMKKKEQKRKELEEKKKILGLETKKEEKVKVANKQVSRNDKSQLPVPEFKKEVIQNEKNTNKLTQEIDDLSENFDEQIDDNQSFEINRRNNLIKEQIKKLESEIKELEKLKNLKKEIQETENAIREIVRKHILHSCNDANVKNIIGNNTNSSKPKNLKELQKKEEELEEKLQEQGGDNLLLEQIETALTQKEQELLELKKQQLNTILLIGRSGRGKSTLANVLVNKNEELEEVFKESSKSVSETRKIQFEQFKDEENNINYLVIDTPGIGDTKLYDHQVLDIIAEVVYLVKDGVSQVFFVTDGRFDQHEMVTYNILRETIFDSDITKHTTIVRTRFKDFRKLEKCKEDIASMSEKVADLKEIIESSNEVIHIDNPSTNIVAFDGDDEDDREDREIKINLNKKTRNKSRKKALDHLSKKCQGSAYKPPKLQELSDEIVDDMDKLIQSRRELAEEMKKLKTQGNKNNNQSLGVASSENKSKSGNISLEDNKEKLTIEVIKKEEQPTEELESNSGIAIGERIAQLEDKKDKLKKEIADKEKIIRQKVLKHIFNNYGAISNEIGGDIFMKSVFGKHDWEEISPEFSNKELVVKWLSQKFDYEQVKKWAGALGKSFKPKEDVGYCTWLRDDKQLTVESIKELDYPRDIEQLRQDYTQKLEAEVGFLDKHNQQLGSEEKKQELSQAQQWLDKNYPKDKRSDIRELNLAWQDLNLEGHLDLSDFVNLTKLNCSGNKLTSLDISQNASLREFWSSWNFLTKIELPKNPQNLVIVDIKNNNFPPQNLNIFSSFINLKELYIGDLESKYIGEGIMYQKERYENYIYNRFSGSLEPLKNLTKLKVLEISNTDIDGGLEYLPGDIEKIVCFTKERPECKSNKIAEEMASYIINEEYQKYNFYDQYYYYDFQAWRKDNADLIKEASKSPAQKWLDANYPREERNKITSLDIRGNNLEGSIMFEGFDNLEYIACGDNKITSLKLNNLPNLAEFYCCNAEISELVVNNCPNISHFDCKLNLLKEFDFNSLNAENLRHLELYNNNFGQDLTDFSRFVNLEILKLGKIAHDYGGNWSGSRHLYTNERNRFYGSLRPLQNLTKLKTLDITNTDIDSGLEYLPASLEEINCDDIKVGSGARCEALKRQLENCEGGKNSYNVTWYDYQIWREDNQEPIEKAKNNDKLIEIQLPLKEIPSEYWDKVEVGNDWDQEYAEAYNDKEQEGGGVYRHAAGKMPMMVYTGGSPWDKRFKNQEILEGFKKYANGEDEFYTRWNWRGILKIKDLPPYNGNPDDPDNWFAVGYEANKGFPPTQYLRDANKLFIKDSYGKVISQEAFEFLQSIIESQEIKVNVKLTEEEFEKFKQENQQLQTQIEILPKQ